jgi:hypothetical protein
MATIKSRKDKPTDQIVDDRSWPFLSESAPAPVLDEDRTVPVVTGGFDWPFPTGKKPGPPPVDIDLNEDMTDDVDEGHIDVQDDTT